MADVIAEAKKQVAQWKANFELHTMLIMRMDGATKPNAQARAYSEGPGGLNNRLPPPVPAAPKKDA